MTLFDDPPDEKSPLSETEKAARVLDYLGDEYGDVLGWLRRRLVLIYRFRREVYGAENAWVTADDARAILPRCPFERPSCNNFLGSLFKGGNWRAVGVMDHRSETPGSHGNRLMRWVYTGELSDGGPYGRDPKDTVPKAKGGG